MTGEIERYAGDAVILATGGYGTVYYLSTNAVNSNVTAAWRAHKRGALFANPCFTQIHPTCIPGQRRSPVEAHADEREPAQRRPRLGAEKQGDTRPPEQIPEEERDYYLERKYPSFGNLVPRDVASRNAKQACDEGRGVGESGLAVYLDFKDAIKRLGLETIKEKYGNLFQMYKKITDEDAYKVPMRIYPGDSLHDGRALGGLQPDEQRAGPPRARRGQFLRPRRESARRQRADAGARGRLLRHPVHHRRLPGEQSAAEGDDRPRRVQGGRGQVADSGSTSCCRSRATAASARFIASSGESCGTTSGWREPRRACGARSRQIPKLREEFWHNVSVPGRPTT